MSRICISIGCGAYRDAKAGLLPAAAKDAKDFFAALCEPKLGAYDRNLSSEIVDAPLAEVRGEIQRVLAKSKAAESLTIYFAGHGIYQNGSFFLCCHDTVFEKPALTALPATELFAVIAESQPRQAFVVIDACQAGGISADINQLIKPEVLAPNGGPNITLFVAAASDQEAYEDEQGGYVTRELLRYVSGQKFFERRNPFLDLAELGRATSLTLQRQRGRQTPAIWGLNLYSEARFTRNPHHQPTASEFDAGFGDLPGHFSDGVSASKEMEALWRLYLDVDKRFHADEVIARLRTVAALLDAEKGNISKFLRSTAAAMSVRATYNDNIFAESEVFLVCAAAALQYEDADSGIPDLIRELAEKCFSAVGRALDQVEKLLSLDRYALLSRRGGTADLYYLPVRISKILGYLGLFQHLAKLLGGDGAHDRTLAIARHVLQHYEGSFVAVSDAQASPLSLFFFSPLLHEVRNEAEKIWSLMLFDIVERNVSVLSADPEPEDVLRYLLSRAEKRRYSGESLAQPSELLSVILCAAQIFDADELVDPFLVKIDHRHCNFYLPTNYAKFGDDMMEDGVNITLQVGSESGIGFFRLSEFRERFVELCAARLSRNQSLLRGHVALGAIMSCIILPDRVPWFLRADLK